MKKQIYSLGLIVAATFALTNCTKEIDQPVQVPESAGIPFEITASTVDTKTAAGDDLTTVWVNNDALSVFHAEAGSTDYGTNDQFTITTETLAQNKFTGTLTEGLDDSKTYDWYAFYPYSEYYNGKSQKIGYTTFGHTCNNFSTAKALRQTGNSSMAHLAGDVFPLYGKASAIAPDEAVSVSMQHLMSVIELKVTNKATEEFTVTGIKFSTPVNVVGSFYYNTSTGVYEPSKDDGSYNSKTSELSVVDAEPIAVDASATFYLAVIPVTLSEGEVSITVVTDKGEQTKNKTLVEGNSDDIVFTAGKIKKMHFDFSAEVALKTVSLPWIEDFGTTESPSDLSNYVIIDGVSETKLYNEASAGGTAPELLIGNTTGSLSVNVNLNSYSGKLTLSFNANYATRIKVTTTAEGVTISDLVANDKVLTCIVTVPEDCNILPLTFSNTTASNVRIDNISLVTGGKEAQALNFATASYVLNVGSDAATNFKGQIVGGAKTTVTYTSSEPSVATVDAANGTVTLVAPGETTITATAEETEDYYSASATYSINYTSVDYVTLPWSFAGGIKSDLTAIPGITVNGLGSDYAESHGYYRLKFDDTGDNIIIKTDASIGKLTIGLKMIGGATGSSFTVSESSDGSTYTELETLSWTGDKNSIHEVSTTQGFNVESRYIKFSFTKGSNIGVGPISVTKPN